MNLSGLNGRAEALSEEKLAELAKDPKNLVYKYEDDPNDAKRELISAFKLAQIITEMRDSYLAVRNEHQDWSDPHIRNFLRRSNKSFDKVFQTYKNIATNITDKETTTKKFENIKFMLAARHQEEIGNMTGEQASAAMQAHLLPQFIKRS